MTRRRRPNQFSSYASWTIFNYIDRLNGWLVGWPSVYWLVVRKFGILLFVALSPSWTVRRLTDGPERMKEQLTSFAAHRTGRHRRVDVWRMCMCGHTRLSCSAPFLQNSLEICWITYGWIHRHRNTFDFSHAFNGPCSCSDFFFI